MFAIANKHTLPCAHQYDRIVVVFNLDGDHSLNLKKNNNKKQFFERENRNKSSEKNKKTN